MSDGSLHQSNFLWRNLFAVTLVATNTVLVVTVLEVTFAQLKELHSRGGCSIPGGSRRRVNDGRRGRAAGE